MIIRPLTIMTPRPTPPGPSFDTVTIGNQIWMSKNLTIDDGQGGITIYTNNYGQGDVVEYFYTWDAAVRVAAAGIARATTPEEDTAIKNLLMNQSI